MNNELFNAEIKERFLSNYTNKSTRRNYRFILAKAKDLEEFFNQDLYSFSFNQFEELMRAFDAKTTKSLGNRRSIIKRYVNWAESQGYCPPNIGLKLLFKEDLKKYINIVAQENKYITREEMYKICDKLYNYQDKAIVVLPFEGVRGRSDIQHTYEEVRNLKPEDIDIKDNTLKLTRDNGDVRNIKVDERSIDILYNAALEQEYHKGNGESTGKFAIRPLADMPYVIRPIERSDSLERISPQAVNSKFYKIRYYLPEYQFLNFTILFQSGMIEKCIEKEKEKGKLQPEDYRNIYTRYGLKEENWYNLKENYTQYKNVSNLKS